MDNTMAEVQQLTTLVVRMMDNQEAHQKETSEHLLRLRENMHEIKNDYHGVSQLTKMVKDEVDELKKLQAKDSEQAFKRIRSAENDVAIIKPQVASYSKLSDNVVKVMTTFAVGAIIASIAFFSMGMK